VFAFTSEANKRFMHGVPRIRTGALDVGCRFSIIAWGRRRSINATNGGANEDHGPRPISVGYSPRAVPHRAKAPPASAESGLTVSEPRAPRTVDVRPVALVQALVTKKRLMATAALRLAAEATGGDDRERRRERRQHFHQGLSQGQEARQKADI